MSHVYRCPSCGAPLTRPTASTFTVACRHCDCEVHLLCAAQEEAARQIEEVERRCEEGRQLSVALRPLVAEAQAEFECAVREERNVDAVLALERVMRLEVAGPQRMMPDVDYEREVVRPAVANIARELGVEIDAVSGEGDSTSDPR